MRKSILLLAATMICSLVSAQKLKEAQVPQVVRDAFKSSYKNIKKVTWEKEGGNYEAEFENGGKENAVVFNTAGSVLETEVGIKPEELPAAAKEYISKNYKTKKIKEATTITDAQGNLNYEAEVDGKDLIFDSSGNYLKTETEMGDDKD